MNKYYRFCAHTGLSVLPLTLINFCRYVKWLPLNGIRSGWPGVKNYVGALAQFNLALGGRDPRDENPELWSLLRKRFKQNTQIVRNHKLKYAIRGGHIQALCLLACERGTPADVAHAACDTLMQFSAVRVGHVAPKDKRSLKHVLCWHHLEFLPSIDDCQFVFIYVESTKSRPGSELKPFWTAIGRVTSCEFICPVRWLVKHFMLNYNGDPAAPLFSGPRGGPLTRATYQSQLQTRLSLAMHRFIPGTAFDVRHYTGISFRKGGITALSRAAAANRLLMHHVADFADHRDISTTRRYDEETIASRAGFSGMIGEVLSL